MKKLLFSMIAAVSLMYAEASFTQTDNISLKWTAFKTPAKIGVGGTFNDINFTAASKEAKTLANLLVGSTVMINTASVNSNNEGRDKKLVDAFFKLMSSGKISAKITDLNATSETTGKFHADIMMNGISKSVPMNYTYENNVLKAEGFIDLFDFNASNSLSSITKACFALHQGKTWNDVTLNVAIPITQSTK